jgi:hypothetical protein
MFVDNFFFSCSFVDFSILLINLIVCTSRVSFYYFPFYFIFAKKIRFTSKLFIFFFERKTIGQVKKVILLSKSDVVCNFLNSYSLVFLSGAHI